jgi:hypothetical protein
MRVDTSLSGYARLLAAATFISMAARPILGSEIAQTFARETAKSPGRLETTLSRPKAYGTEDYSVTMVPAIAFYPETGGQAYYTSGSLGRFGPINTLQNFYAPIDLPHGVRIDYIGLNSQTDAPFALGVELYARARSGELSLVGEFSSTVHAWGMDYNADPIRVTFGVPQAMILKVQQGIHPTPQFFGHVEVWWRREVRDPETVTFSDVPPDHPFFPFIEALAASGITAGCGGANFCPDQPLTRGQMAAFLAKALGLHWGVAGPP